VDIFKTPGDEYIDNQVTMIAFGRTMAGSHHEIDVALWRQPVQHTKDEY
jgi:hypothetical protein